VAEYGDKVFLKRGDVFYGTLAPKDDNIHIADYTDDNFPTPPKISGFIDIWQFSLHQGNIYKCFLATRPKVIAMNGNLLELGRTPNIEAPNGGYYTYNNPGGTDINLYIQAESAGQIDHLAKEVVIRTNNFTIEAKPIIQFDGDKIYYGATTGFNGANNSFAPQHGYGYYFQNGINTLDRHGEWFYDEDQHTLYVYFEGPLQTIQVSNIDVLCDFKKYSNMKISNIDFEGANRMGIDMGNNSDLGENFNISIENCRFSYMGVRAIHGRHVRQLNIQECSFSNCLSGGVQFYTFFYSGWQPNVKVYRCNFKNIAPWPGMAYNTDMGDNCAIASFVSNTCAIVDNTFEDIGKAAIFWQGSYVSITENNISNAMKNFSDYGAIYTWTDGTAGFTERLIENNLIHDCPGNFAGTPAKAVIANGIYLDGTTREVMVRRNTIFNMGSSGISCNNPRTVTLTANTLYDNPNGIRCGHVGNYLPEGENIEIKLIDNKIYSSRGQENPTLLNSNNTMTSAVSFEGDETNWQQDLQNIYCEGNAYGLTHPRPFYVEVPAGSGGPSSFISLPKWTQLANETSTRTFPARANFMPNGQAYKIGSSPEPINPIYDLMSIATIDMWTNGDPTVSKTSVPHPDGYNEMKIEFNTPIPNIFAPFTKLIGATLIPNRKYVFSYQIRAEAGTNGICNSSVRMSGCGTGCIFYPTSENYRSYTDQPITVEYLIYVPVGFTGSPVFTINIEKTSGTTYLSHIKIQPYEQADVQVDDADDFVHFAYNPTWLGNPDFPFIHALPVQDLMYEDGFGFNPINIVYFMNSPGDNFSHILFRSGLINARPYRATPLLAPIEENLVKIAVYPNPATNTITIDKLNPLDNWQQINVINQEGKIVLTKKITEGIKYTTLSLGNLNNGFYTLCLLNSKGYITRKFIKK